MTRPPSAPRRDPELERLRVLSLRADERYRAAVERDAPSDVVERYAEAAATAHARYWDEAGMDSLWGAP